MSSPIKADARPTKGLFVDMLTKDIELSKAISDLVDNSVDGAKRLRPNAKYDGLSVEIEFDKKGAQFLLWDNCGGIPLDKAEKYAFRFGRPEDAEDTKGSIGQFGVGMKRSIFKIGREFLVESRTDKDHFIVKENVNTWMKNESWDFLIQPITHDKGKLTTHGTRILVTQLNDISVANFALGSFEKRLYEELVSDHQKHMENGLKIYLNKKPLHFEPLKLKLSDAINPAYKRIEKGTPGSDNHIIIEIFAGVGESVPKDAGWYVFCNGRLLLEADQTTTTGWGEKELQQAEEIADATKGEKIPHMHNQFARFRGFVFFESDNTSLLPWNTTKNGVDKDSPVLKSARREMQQLMRPIIDFLNDLREEEKNTEEDDKRPLREAIESARTINVSALAKKESTFKAPKYTPQTKPPKKQPKTTSIQFEKPVEDVEKVKKALKVKSNTKVGEKIFDYYYKNEVGDD